MSKEKSKEIVSPGVEIRLPRNVLTEIVNETRDHAGIETAGLIFGLRLETTNGQRLVFTNSLNGIDVDRSQAMVKIGGPNLNNYQNWAHLAWENILKNDPLVQERKDLWYADFGLVGIWHSHPSGNPTFSPTDDMTADWALGNHPFDDFLFLITSPDEKVHEASYMNLTVKDLRGKTSLRFYYRHRNYPNMTKVVIPTIEEPGMYPAIPDTPWFISNSELFAKEVNELKKFGCRPKTRFISTVDRVGPPLLWFICTNPKSGQEFYIGTDHKFDKTGLAFFTSNDPQKEEFYKKGFQLTFKLKEYGADSLADLIGFYSLFSLKK